MHVGIEQEGCGAEEGVCQPAQLPRHLRLHLPHLPHAAVLPAHPLRALSGFQSWPHFTRAYR